MADYELSEFNCEGNCIVSTCKPLQRLVSILKVYDKWLYNEDKRKMLYDTLIQTIQSFTTKNTINDYKHIKEMNYDMIINNTSCSRSITQCIPSNRHRRNNNTNYRQIYYTTEIKEILLQKTMDQIHLYLYHPLSHRDNIDKTSYNNNRFGTEIDEKQPFINNGDAKEDIIEEEQKETKDVEEEEEEEKQDNMAYVLSDDIKEDEEEKTGSASTFCVGLNSERDAYNFGQNYFYWKYYENDKWFVTSKYDNLKDELLNNVFCKIEQFDWDLEYENAVEKK